MNIKKIFGDYVECGEFEIKIIGGKVKVYYHDKIDHFSNDKIIISKKNNKYLIEGKNLAIETMFKEFIIISGQIKKISLGYDNE